MHRDDSGLHSFSRRVLLRGLASVAGAGALGVIVVACGSSTAGPPATQATSSAKPTAAPALAPTAAPAAQASNGNATGGQTVLTWMGWGGFDQSTAQRREPLLKQYFPDLAAKYTLKGVSGGKGDFDMAQKLRLMLAASGSGLPDVTYFNYTQIPEFFSAGELVELSSQIAPYKADLSNATTQLSQYNGKTVTFPDSIKGKVSFYRSDLFDQAGMKWSDIKTLEDFVTAGKQFHQKFPKSYLLNLDGNPAQYWMGEILSAYVPNIQFSDESGKYQITSNPAFKTMFDTMKQLESVSVNIDDFSNDWPPAFANSTICGSVIATWMINFLPQYAPKQKGMWKIDKWFTIDGKSGGSEAGGGVNAFWKKSPNRDAAIEVVGQLMLSKQGNIGNIVLNGQLPLVKSVQADAKKYFQQYKPGGGQDPNLFLTNYFGIDSLDPIFASYDDFKVLPYD
ncbi:MAG: ABC transporter substrate-binding protein, partial [Candidatus Dormibacteraceae bacterium]